ncbi:alpha-(1-_3)-arabinofuranosyltransferase domain-containing protein [Nocardioides sp. GXZ039]|uniref:alpha-(1->3)-arabinofuranosyltransferase domain-containing protein n=1 Tax=Nocardioides sp. GXZ039 TaxID=3136018 RepID=UPI0030F46024
MLVWVLLIGANLLQQPGRTTWDTKYDLTAAPGEFLARSLHLWNPDSSMGELQNQAYGYLFPQGPFFLLGELVSMPDWVVQRLWSALLLISAFEGTRAVARALGAGRGSAIIGGLVYALSPRLLGAVGILSGEVLPTAVLPWAVLPLVLARSGRLSNRQAALWTGVALLFMSGVNAAGTVATFPLLILLMFDVARRSRDVALVAWSALAVVAATAWWAIPLLLLGRYSPPFLDFIETASSTTNSTGWANDVRGSEHWLGYFVIGDQPWWPGAHAIATTPALIILGAAITALGLGGLVHRQMPARGVLVASAVIGLLCLTAGNVATGGSLLASEVQSLLDGVLAPLRNVHKVDPIIRLPLALGAAHAFGLLCRRVRDAELRRWVGGVIAVGVLAAGLPLFAGDIRMPGFDHRPDAWAQTADYLADQPDSRALVLPGSGFGLQSWGWTIDEPLQGEARSAWVTRSQVPLVPGPTARYLDTIERRINSGEGSPELAAMLARGGITHVVLRRDLDPFRTETVPADRAETALLRSPGIAPVASFGDSGFAGVPMIDVYRVEGADSGVSLLDLEQIPRVVGSPDDLLPAMEAGLLSAAPAIIEPNTEGSDAPAVVGDSYADVERQFGRVHDATSDIRARGEPRHEDRRQVDFPGVPSVPRVSSEPAGAMVTASSSRGYADEYGAVRPEFAPSAAFDGNANTAWQSGSLRSSTDQWLQLDLVKPVEGGSMAVTFADVASGATVVRARVTMRDTDGQVFEAVYGVPADGVLLVPVPAAPIDRVRIAAEETRGENPAFGHVAISEVSLPAVPTGRATAISTPLRPIDSLVLRTDPPRRACVDIGLGPNCTPSDRVDPADAGRIDRLVEVTEAGSWELSGTVVAAPTRAAAALLAPLDGKVDARAYSVLAGDPAVSGVFAFDGDPRTPWLSEPGAPQARLVLRLPESRTIDSLKVFGAPGRGVTPTVAVIRSRGESRTVDLGFDNSFEPLRTGRRVTITLRRGDDVTTRRAPLGIGEIEVGGLNGLAHAPDLDARTGAVCGLGPQVIVDGVARSTSVSGTVDDVRLGTPLRWTVCDGPVDLAPGRHLIEAVPSFQFRPATLGWRPVDGAAVADTARSARSVEVESWSDSHREVQVGPGDAAVLRVPENLNDGWVATLDGESLETVSLDGWQQGYIVPAGEGGRVVLAYRPDGIYRAGLLIGLVLAVLLVLAAAYGQITERRSERRTGASGDREPVTESGPRRSLTGVRRWVALGLCGTGFLALGGPAAALGFVAPAMRRLRAVAVPLGLVSIVASGLLSAWASSTLGGRPPTSANLVAGLGVGLLVGSVAFGARTASWSACRRSVRSRLRVLAHSIRSNPVVVAGLCLIVAQAVVRLAIAQGSYYWQDDFVHLDMAHRVGLSKELIVRQHNEHVEFGPFAFYWVLSLADGVTFVPAVIALVALQLVAALLFWILLCQIFGRRIWLLIPLAAYLFTPISLVGATWFASGVEAFTLHIAMFTALLGLVRLRRTGNWPWGLVSVLGFTFGLLCWQKSAVVLPVLVAVDVLVLGAGLPLRERIRAWRGLWWLWSALVGVLVVYIAVYLSLTTSESFGGAVSKDVPEALQDMLLKVFIPGMFGGPWTGYGASNSAFPNAPLAVQVIGLVLVLLVVVASVLRSGRKALAGWILAVGYVAGDALLLFAGRAEFLGLVSRDPRYFTDAVPVVLIAVSAAFAAPRRRPPVDEGGGDVGTSRRASWSRVAIPVALASAVAVSGLVTTSLLAPSVQHEEARRYVENLVEGVGSDPGASISSAYAPDDIALLRSSEMLLGSVGMRQVLDRPGTVPYGVDGSGHVVPMRLSYVDVSETGPAPQCGWALNREPRRLLTLDAVSDKRILRLSYLAGKAGVMHVEIDGVDQAVSIPAGVGEAYISVTGLAGAVDAWVSGGDGACVTTVERGVLVPAS